MVACRHRGDNGCVAGSNGIFNDLRVHFADLAHKAEVFGCGQLIRLQHGAVKAAQADRLAAGVFQKLYEVFIDFACQHLLHNVHRLRVGIAHTADKAAFLADLFQHAADLRAAAVHQHDIHADELHQHNIVHHGFFQLRVNHSIAAVFDDDGLARPPFDIRHRLHEHMGAVAVRDADLLFFTHVL